MSYSITFGPPLANRRSTFDSRVVVTIASNGAGIGLATLTLARRFSVRSSLPPSLPTPESYGFWGPWQLAEADSGAPPMSPREFAAVAKAMAHPARVAIVQRLAHGQESVAGDIVRESGLAQSTVSEHLRVLRDAGVLSSRKEGPRVWYQLRADLLRLLARTLEDLVDE